MEEDGGKFDGTSNQTLMFAKKLMKSNYKMKESSNSKKTHKINIDNEKEEKNSRFGLFGSINLINIPIYL